MEVLDDVGQQIRRFEPLRFAFTDEGRDLSVRCRRAQIGDTYSSD